MKLQDLLSIPGNASFVAKPDLIHPGDKVLVSNTYKVKQGDTLSHIAVAHGMKWQDLLSIPGNESFIANPDLIHPGDIVHLAGE